MSSSNQLAEDFAFFIHNSTDYRMLTVSTNLERTCSICLNLLTTIPSAREAIFDYFNSLINIGVHCFIQNDAIISSKSLEKEIRENPLIKRKKRKTTLRNKLYFIM